MERVFLLCKDCHKPISPEAQSCPNCGNPDPFMKKEITKKHTEEKISLTIYRLIAAVLGGAFVTGLLFPGSYVCFFISLIVLASAFIPLFKKIYCNNMHKKIDEIAPSYSRYFDDDEERDKIVQTWKDYLKYEEFNGQKYYGG